MRHFTISKYEIGEWFKEPQMYQSTLPNHLTGVNEAIVILDPKNSTKVRLYGGSLEVIEIEESEARSLEYILALHTMDMRMIELGDFLDSFDED